MFIERIDVERFGALSRTVIEGLGPASRAFLTFGLVMADMDLDGDAAQIWGRLRVPHSHNAIDKQIAAIALLHDLTVVTRNTDDFVGCGVRLLNPFQAP